MAVASPRVRIAGPKPDTVPLACPFPADWLKNLPLENEHLGKNRFAVP